MTEAASSADTQRALLPRARERLVEQERKSRSAGAWLVGSAVLFIVVGMGNFDLPTLGILMAVLLFHELGHLAAMWAFGYRDLKVFFIPLLGAATSGKAHGVGVWKRVVVLLAGPVPGILAAYVLMFVMAVKSGSPPWVGEVVGLLVFINGFNLLPFVPLDGGRVVAMALFSRSPRLETGFTILSAAGLMFVALYLEAWILVAIGFFIATGAFSRAPLVVRAHALREHLAGASADPAELGEHEHAILYEAAIRHLESRQTGARREINPQTAARTLGAYMRILHERAVLPSPSLGASVGSLCAYVGALLLLAPMVVLLFLGSD